jgi:CheY-like chemotaxis protein
MAADLFPEPLSATDVPLAEDHPAALAEHADPVNKTVLVVDDEELVRTLTARILQEAGYRVLTASDGFEALATLEQVLGSVDLLVTDLTMPGMSGEQLAQRVCQRSPAPSVLFISGFFASAAASTLSSPILAKPFSCGDLLRTVGHLVQLQI